MYTNWEKDQGVRQGRTRASPHAPTMLGEVAPFHRRSPSLKLTTSTLRSGVDRLREQHSNGVLVRQCSSGMNTTRMDGCQPSMGNTHGGLALSYTSPTTAHHRSSSHASSRAAPGQIMSIWASWKKSQSEQAKPQEGHPTASNTVEMSMKTTRPPTEENKGKKGVLPPFGRRAGNEVHFSIPNAKDTHIDRSERSALYASSSTEGGPTLLFLPFTTDTRGEGVVSVLAVKPHRIDVERRGTDEEKDGDKRSTADQNLVENEATSRSSLSHSCRSLPYAKARRETVQFVKTTSKKECSSVFFSPATTNTSTISPHSPFFPSGSAPSPSPLLPSTEVDSHSRRQRFQRPPPKDGGAVRPHSPPAGDPPLPWTSLLEDSSFLKVVDDLPPSFQDTTDTSRTRTAPRPQHELPSVNHHSSSVHFPLEKKLGASHPVRQPPLPIHSGRHARGKGTRHTSTPPFSSSSPVRTSSCFTAAGSLPTTSHTGSGRVEEGSLGGKEGRRCTNGEPRSGEGDHGKGGGETSGQGCRNSQNNMLEGVTPQILLDLNATLTGTHHSTFELTRSAEGSPNQSKTNFTGSFLQSSGFSAAALLEGAHPSFNSTLNVNDTIGRAERAGMLAEMKLQSDEDEEETAVPLGGTIPQEENPQPSLDKAEMHAGAEDKNASASSMRKKEVVRPAESRKESETLFPSSLPFVTSPPFHFLSSGMEELKVAVQRGKALTEEGEERERSHDLRVEWTTSSFSSASPPLHSITGSGSAGWHTSFQRGSPFIFTPTSSTGVGTMSTFSRGGGVEGHFPLYSSSSHLSHPLAHTQQLLPSARTMAAIAHLCPQPAAFTQNDLSTGEGLSVERLRRWYGPSTTLTHREDNGRDGEDEGEEEDKEGGDVRLRKGGKRVSRAHDQCSVWSEAQSLFRGRAPSDALSSRMGVSHWDSESLSSRSFGGSTSSSSHMSSKKTLSVGWIQSSPLFVPHIRKHISWKDKAVKERKPKIGGKRVVDTSDGSPLTRKRIHHHPRLPPLPTWEWRKGSKGNKVVPQHYPRHRWLHQHRKKDKKYLKWNAVTFCYDGDRSGGGEGNTAGAGYNEEKDDGILKSLVFKGTTGLQRSGGAMLHRAMVDGIRSIRRKAAAKPQVDETIQMVRQWCDRTSIEKTEEGHIAEDPIREHLEAMEKVQKEEERTRSLQHFSRLRHREKLKMESEAARDALGGRGRLAYPSGSHTAAVSMRKMLGEEWSSTGLDHHSEGMKSTEWDIGLSSSPSAMRRRMMMMDEKKDNFVENPLTGNLLRSHQTLCSRLNPFGLPEEEQGKNAHDFVSLVPRLNTEDEGNEVLDRSTNYASEDNLSIRELSRRSIDSSIAVNSTNDFSFHSFSSGISPPLSPLGFSATSTIPALMPTSFDGEALSGGVGAPSPVENALLDLLLLALVENSVWGNPSKPYKPQFPCLGFPKGGDVVKLSKRLADIYLKNPVEFTDLCQLSEVHAALAEVAKSADLNPKTSTVQKPFGVRSKLEKDSRSNSVGLVLPIPARATVGPNGHRVFTLRFFEKEKKGSTGLKGMEQSVVEVLPLHLTFVLRRPIEEGGTPLRCCVAVDLLQLFHQLPSILADHLVRSRGGGPSMNPLYAVRMPQWCKSVWYSVMMEVKRELVFLYLEESKASMGVGVANGNAIGMCDADRVFLEQQMLQECVLEAFEVDWKYCIALSRWRMSSLKQLANTCCGVQGRRPVIPFTSSASSAFPGSSSVKPFGRDSPAPESNSPTSTRPATISLPLSSPSMAAGVSDRATETTPWSAEQSQLLHSTPVRQRLRTEEHDPHCKGEGDGGVEKGLRSRYSSTHPPSMPSSSLENEKGWKPVPRGNKEVDEEDKAKVEREMRIPVAPGPRVYYPLDMQTLYVTASLALDQNNAILFPRIERLRAKYEELEMGFHEAYSPVTWGRRRTGIGGGTSNTSPSSGGRNTNNNSSRHRRFSGEELFPGIENGTNLEKPRLGLATALQQWSSFQKMLDTETSYQLCLQHIHFNELSIINFNAHVTPYNTYRAKESAVWGPIYLSGLRLAYALCVYLESKPLYCMPENFTGLFYPLAQFSGCGDGYQEMKANLKAVKNSISERCRRVSLAVEMMTVEAAEKLLQEAVEVLGTKCQTASEIVSCQAVEEDVLTTSISLVPLPEKKFTEVDLLEESEDVPPNG